MPTVPTPPKWLLRITPDARRSLSNLPAKPHASVLKALDELLSSDNPYRARNTLKIEDSEGLWRKRQGDFRLLFALNTQPITHEGVTYKGALTLVDVRKRDEGTYR